MGRVPLHAGQPEGLVDRALVPRPRMPALVRPRARHVDERDPAGRDVSYRLPKGGRLIDRTKPISFLFDGTEYEGFVGDTVASALLANGVVGGFRSPILGRPRGVMTDGPEEPCALVRVNAPWQDIIAPAPMVELAEGLEVVSCAGGASLSGNGSAQPPPQLRYTHVETLVIGSHAAGRAAADE